MKTDQPEPHTGGWRIEWRLSGKWLTRAEFLCANKWSPVEHEDWDEEEDAMERLKLWQGYSFASLMDFRVVKI